LLSSEVNVPSVSTGNKKINFFCFGILKARYCRKQQEPDPDPDQDPYRNPVCGSEDPYPYHNVTYGTVSDTLIERSYRYRTATEMLLAG
jgi:hypothetical protein